MIDQLKKAGLNDYQAKAYMALAKYGAQAGREVARHSGIPVTRVFDVLKSLVEKGLVNLIEEKPMLFRAIEPNIGLKSLFESKIESLKAAEKETFDSLKEFKKPVSEVKIHEKVTTVLGYSKHYSYFANFTKGMKKSLWVFSVGEEVPYSTKILVRKAVKNGIDCRLIVTKCDEENRHILKEHMKNGWKLKYYPSTGEYTFAIIDEKIGMVNVRNPEVKEERISIFLEVPGLAKALREYFEVLWKKAEAVKL